MVARLIADAEGRMEAQMAVQRQQAEAKLTTVLGRLNQTEDRLNRTQSDLNRTQSHLDRTQSDLIQTRVALRGAQGEIHTRLSTCEANSTALQAEAEARAHARRLQEAHTCTGAGLETMLASCCGASGGGGHRRLQSGCDAFPTTCSAFCAPLFVGYCPGPPGAVKRPSRLPQ